MVAIPTIPIKKCVKTFFFFKKSRSIELSHISLLLVFYVNFNKITNFKDIYGIQCPSSDDSYKVTSLGFSFSYYLKNYTEVTISTNGYVCLGSNSQCCSTMRPSSYDIIVGLNYDLKTSRSGSGQIYYQSVNSSSNFFAQSQTYVNLLNLTFIPTNVFMITYDRVLPHSSNSTSLTSFQIFLTSNLFKSYVIFNFTSCPTDLHVNALSGLNHFIGAIWLEGPSITNWCTASNVGLTGVWVFDVSNGKRQIN